MIIGAVNPLLRNLAPGGLLLALTVAGMRFDWFALPAATLAFGCYAACVATALLAWRFHSSRLAIGAALVAAAVLALRTLPQAEGLVSVVLPLNFIALAVTPEGGFVGA